MRGIRPALLQVIGKERILAVSVVVALFVVLTLSNPSSFLSSYNIGTLLDYATTYFVAAVGLTFVILIGSIDLSLGGMLSLFTVIFAMALNHFGSVAYVLIMLLGLACGFLNGVVFTRLEIPSFIGTFGTAGVYQSLALILSGGRPVGLNVYSVQKLGILGFEFGALKSIHILGVVLFVIFWIVQNYLPFGRYIFAVGSSERAAYLSGVRVSRVKTLAFVISGLSASLAAIVLVARMFSGDPTIGMSYQLPIIATVVVGGNALTGGVGGIFNTLLGTFVVVLVGNGLNVIGVDVYYQTIVTGIITMIAVALTLDKSKVRVVK
ncbi:MAG: ABC transporter permease [Candidatus Methanomethylicaceae archaeon]